MERKKGGGAAVTKYVHIKTTNIWHFQHANSLSLSLLIFWCRCDSQADSPLLLCQSVLLHFRDWQVAGLFSLSFLLFLFSYHTLHTWVSPTTAVILITLAVLHHSGIIIREVCLSGVHYPPRPVLNILPVHYYFYVPRIWDFVWHQV